MTPEQLREGAARLRRVMAIKPDAGYAWDEWIDRHCHEVIALALDAERYRRALLDLADRGHGVRRPKWVCVIIDAARASGADEP